MLWRVVYIAPSREVADKVRNLLTTEGFLITVRSAGISEGLNNGVYEVLVPESEIEEAHETLSQLLTSRTRFSTE